MSIFIFRRDLRLYDNVGMLELQKHTKEIIPIFIFTPEQITSKNKFKSNNAIQFMIESLKELRQEFKKRNGDMLFFQGDNLAVLKRIHKTIGLENIGFNRDYTPYARKRDDEIEKWAKSQGIECHITEDYLLSPIGELNKSDGNPYTVFTPFKNNGLSYNVPKPRGNAIKSIASITTVSSFASICKPKGIPAYSENESILVRGGRTKGLVKLQGIKKLRKYDQTRNTPSIQTTELSAYIKFGNLSIREVYHKIKTINGLQSGLISQLFWREFYFYIAYYFPHVLQGKALVDKYDKVKWIKKSAKLDKWKRGMTGYPIVDAGMRQLNQTGYMHNRLRLITSNFLNRLLGMDWREGELYYAQQLTDYDPSVNNGNWQWIASVGVDTKPYFQRLFNPWLQSEKFDKNAEYIKRWIPELKNVPSEHLHKWEEYYKTYPKINYPAPVVDYKRARERSVTMYRAVIK
jgi:deoxyribodipyrimidine photo-lyase